MNVRHIYLKIETVPNYSPVAPDDAEHHKHRLDCMRNMEHTDATIPQAEVDRRSLDALVYREYLDAAYTVIKNTPLIAADINEPRVERRIPGTVIYTQPGERLYVHVLNGDSKPHSLHVHGLHYGIDSDGSWPFGVQEYDGPNRSDAICPEDQWCYVFDVKEDAIGAWPFHDHHMHIEEAVKRGLFGGIVVRDPHCDKADLEVPIFFTVLQRMSAPRSLTAARSMRAIYSRLRSIRKVRSNTTAVSIPCKGACVSRRSAPLQQPLIFWILRHASNLMM